MLRIFQYIITKLAIAFSIPFVVITLDTDRFEIDFSMTHVLILGLQQLSTVKACSHKIVVLG